MLRSIAFAPSKSGACEIPIKPWLVPISARGQLPVEIVAKLFLAEPQLEGIEPVDDLAHNVARFHHR